MQNSGQEHLRSIVLGPSRTEGGEAAGPMPMYILASTCGQKTLHETFMDAQPMPSMLLGNLQISQLGPSAHSANRPSCPNPGANLGTSQQKQSFELSARTRPSPLLPTAFLASSPRHPAHPHLFLAPRHFCTHFSSKPGLDSTLLGAH